MAASLDRLFIIILTLSSVIGSTLFAAEVQVPVPIPPWKIELVAQAPAIKHPSVVCSAPDGRVFVAEDPMDITAAADATLGRILCFQTDGRMTVFAEGLYAVFGMQYLEGKLYVLHNPKFSVFTDVDGMGKDRQDLIESTNPNPWALDWNDHVPANFRLAMDGYFYIAVGDKGIFGAVGRDGSRADLQGGGILRMRPGGTELEVYCTGVRNILDVALNEEDELFTYDNTDEQQWMGRLTHMVDRGFYGYPHNFIPRRPYTLWMMADYGGGAATGALCYNEDALPAEYHGNLFLADFGKRQVMRVRVSREGGSFRAREKIDLFLNPPADFRPVGIGWSADGAGIYICDWQHRDVKGQAVVGRLWKLTFAGNLDPAPKPKWFLPAAMGQPSEATSSELLAGLHHPARSVRLTAQRKMAEGGMRSIRALTKILADKTALPRARWHALWALDAIDGGISTRKHILSAASDRVKSVQRQAIRELGQRKVKQAAPVLLACLKNDDPSVRFQAAAALGRMGAGAAIPSLIQTLSEKDLFARYAVFASLNRIGRAHPALWAEIARGLADDEPLIREGTSFALRETYDLALVEVLCQIASGDQRKSGGRGPALFRREVNGRASESGVSPLAREAAIKLLAPLHRQTPAWKGEWWAYHPVNSPPPAKNIEWSGTAQILESLRAALDDPSLLVRRAAVDGIQEAKDLPAAGKLRTLFEREEDLPLRGFIISALGEIRDAESKGLIGSIIAQRNSEPALVESALKAARQIGGSDLGAVVLNFLKRSHTPVALQKHALQAMAEIRLSDSASTLAAYATNSDSEIRSIALEALVTSQKGEASKWITPLLDHASAGVRRSAVSALGHLRSNSTRGPLLKAFQDPETRREAIMALARTPELEAIEAYLEGLGDENPALREVSGKAVRALGPQSLEVVAARIGQLPITAIAELRRVFGDNPEAKKLLEAGRKVPEERDYLEFALTNPGAAERGRKIFLDPNGVACVKCHALSGQGGGLGPDLATAGAQFSRKELAESILFPSKIVREGYQSALVRMRNGDEFSGLSKGETSAEIMLLDTEGRLQRIAKADVASRSQSDISLMPEGLHLGLTFEQFADLVSFLEALKGNNDGR